MLHLSETERYGCTLGRGYCEWQIATAALYIVFLAPSSWVISSCKKPRLWWWKCETRGFKTVDNKSMDDVPVVYSELTVPYRLCSRRRDNTPQRDPSPPRMRTDRDTELGVPVTVQLMQRKTQVQWRCGYLDIYCKCGAHGLNIWGGSGVCDSGLIHSDAAESQGPHSGLSLWVLTLHHSGAAQSCLVPFSLYHSLFHFFP